VLGCGKKAPPVPPHQAKPPTVTDLRASIDGGTLKLTWSGAITYPESLEKGYRYIYKVIVYGKGIIRSDSS